MELPPQTLVAFSVYCLFSSMVRAGWPFRHLRSVGGFRLHSLRSAGLHIAARESRTLKSHGASVRSVPGERRGILRENFLADLAVFQFCGIGAQAGLHGGVDVDRAGALDAAAGTCGRVVIGGRGVRFNCLVSAGLHGADAADVGIHCIGAGPIQRGSLAAIDVRRRNVEVAGYRSDDHLGAGGSRLESRQGSFSFSPRGQSTVFILPFLSA